MHASGNPVVSIIMATYNRASLIGQAIESVTGQSLIDWELIVADDGSTDNTAEVLREWEAKEPRIRYLRLPHAGRIAVVSNAALEAARGKYIAVLDDDDRWIDHCLRTHPATGKINTNTPTSLTNSLNPYGRITGVLPTL